MSLKKTTCKSFCPILIYFSLSHWKILSFEHFLSFEFQNHQKQFRGKIGQNKICWANFTSKSQNNLDLTSRSLDRCSVTSTGNRIVWAVHILNINVGCETCQACQTWSYFTLLCHHSQQRFHSGLKYVMCEQGLSDNNVMCEQSLIKLSFPWSDKYDL